MKISRRLKPIITYQNPTRLKTNRSLLTALLLAPLVVLEAAERFPGATEDYHGAALFTVPIGTATAKVLCPQKPIQGLLWVLAPALYNPDDPQMANLARTELELVKRGFHVVAFDPGNSSESPHRWDTAFAELTGKYKLWRNAALMAMGSESFPVANWAAANPGKSLCLYLDHPVFKEIPRPDGKPGSPRETAVNLAKKLTVAKVALIVVGADSSAQASGNETFTQEYAKLGGILKMVPGVNQPGSAFGLIDPAPVLNFIRYRAVGLPEPTFQCVAYGHHPKQIIDFWQVPSGKPAPLVVYIHGGGWSAGSYINGSAQAEDYLKAGISVASVEYRFISEATLHGVKPPVKGPMDDVARAVQFLRSKAGEWNIRKDRIAATGVSAGACSSLWLAFHKDLADPKSDDPVARESTRLFCAAVQAAQTSLDPAQMKLWTPNIKYGGHAFGFAADPSKKLSEFDVFLANRDSILPWIAEYSPYALATPDAPPICMTYDLAPQVGKDQPDPIHTANFGAKLQERLRELKVDCELVYPGAPDVRHRTIEDYLIERLIAP